MPSQFATPLLLTEDATTQLERLPLSSQPGSNGYDEAWLQKTLFEHPACLPIEEVDRSFLEPQPVCMELGTFGGSLDVLFVTPQGKLVLAETKLWRNPEARREVVAQVMDYAKDLARWRYEDLEREVARKTGRQGNALYQMVADHPSAITEAEFVDEVSRSLRSGRFLLLVVGDGIKEGVGSITQFLEEYAHLQFTFGLVELALYRIHGSEVLVQPRVLAKSAILGRWVVEVDGDQCVPKPGREEADAGSNPAAEFYRDFWQEFLNELRLDDDTQPKAQPTKHQNVYFGMPPSSSEVSLNLYFAPSKQEVGVYLSFTRGSYADYAIPRLLEEKEEIIQELGGALDWEVTDNHPIRVRQYFFDPLAEANREPIKAFLADWTNRFVNALRQRLDRISREAKQDQ